MVVVVETDDAYGKVDFFTDFALCGGDGVKARSLWAEELEQGLRIQWVWMGGKYAYGRCGSEVGVQLGFICGDGFEFFVV